ncbi:AAB_G0006480.mRNA.1.CDS.1 [Saccharomyces cerevisiae]|nr:AAB_G0006480.mRNA.1.CDS.1 [Saccharomyces cerevisiae]
MNSFASLGLIYSVVNLLTRVEAQIVFYQNSSTSLPVPTLVSTSIADFHESSSTGEVQYSSSYSYVQPSIDSFTSSSFLTSFEAPTETSSSYAVSSSLITSDTFSSYSDIFDEETSSLISTSAASSEKASSTLSSTAQPHRTSHSSSSFELPVTAPSSSSLPSSTSLTFTSVNPSQSWTSFNSEKSSALSSTIDFTSSEISGSTSPKSLESFDTTGTITSSYSPSPSSKNSNQTSLLSPLEPLSSSSGDLILSSTIQATTNDQTSKTIPTLVDATSSLPPTLRSSSMAPTSGSDSISHNFTSPPSKTSGNYDVLTSNSIDPSLFTTTSEYSSTQLSSLNRASKSETVNFTASIASTPFGTDSATSLIDPISSVGSTASSFVGISTANFSTQGNSNYVPESTASGSSQYQDWSSSSLPLSQTTWVVINTTNTQGSVTSTTSPAYVSTATKTVDGVITEYVTWCPLTQTKSQAIGVSSSISSVPQASLFSGSSILSSNSSTLAASNNVPESTASGSSQYQDWSSSSLPLSQTTWVVINTTNTQGSVTSTTSPAYVSTATKTVDGVITEYVTWCPLTQTKSQAIGVSSSISSVPQASSFSGSSNSTTLAASNNVPESTASGSSQYQDWSSSSLPLSQTTWVVINTTNTQGSVTSTTSPAYVSTATKTVDGVITEYVTWCPLTQTKSQAIGVSSSISSVPQASLFSGSSILSSNSSTLAASNNVPESTASGSSQYQDWSSSSLPLSQTTWVVINTTNTQGSVTSTTSPAYVSTATKTVDGVITEYVTWCPLTQTKSQAIGVSSSISSVPQASSFSGSSNSTTLAASNNVPESTASGSSQYQDWSSSSLPLSQTTWVVINTTNTQGSVTSTTSPAYVSTATKTVDGVITEYVTWCPLTQTKSQAIGVSSSISSVPQASSFSGSSILSSNSSTLAASNNVPESTASGSSQYQDWSSSSLPLSQTTWVVINTTNTQGSVTSTASPAYVSTATKTVDGVITEYVTWCPLTQTKSQAIGISSSTISATQTSKPSSILTLGISTLQLSDATFKGTETINTLLMTESTLITEPTYFSGTSDSFYLSTSEVNLASSLSSYPNFSSSEGSTATITNSTVTFGSTSKYPSTSVSNPTEASQHVSSSVNSLTDFTSNSTETIAVISNIHKTSSNKDYSSTTTQLKTSGMQTLVLSTVTTTVNGAATEYTTWCPATSIAYTTSISYKTLVLTTEVCSHSECTPTVITSVTATSSTIPLLSTSSSTVLSSTVSEGAKNPAASEVTINTQVSATSEATSTSTQVSATSATATASESSTTSQVSATSEATTTSTQVSATSATATASESSTTSQVSATSEATTTSTQVFATSATATASESSTTSQVSANSEATTTSTQVSATSATATASESSTTSQVSSTSEATTTSTQVSATSATATASESSTTSQVSTASETISTLGTQNFTTTGSLLFPALSTEMINTTVVSRKTLIISTEVCSHSKCVPTVITEVVTSKGTPSNGHSSQTLQTEAVEVTLSSHQTVTMSTEVCSNSICTPTVITSVQMRSTPFPYLTSSTSSSSLASTKKSSLEASSEMSTFSVSTQSLPLAFTSSEKRSTTSVSQWSNTVSTNTIMSSSSNVISTNEKPSSTTSPYNFSSGYSLPSSSTPSQYSLSTATTTINGIKTVYTTWCPLAEKSTVAASSQSSRSVDRFVSSSKPSSSLSQTSIQYTLSTATTTISGLKTVYTTWCPLTSKSTLGATTQTSSTAKVRITSASSATSTSISLSTSTESESSSGYLSKGVCSGTECTQDVPTQSSSPASTLAYSPSVSTSSSSSFSTTTASTLTSTHTSVPLLPSSSSISASSPSSTSLLSTSLPSPAFTSSTLPTATAVSSSTFIASSLPLSSKSSLSLSPVSSSILMSQFSSSSSSSSSLASLPSLSISPTVDTVSVLQPTTSIATLTCTDSQCQQEVSTICNGSNCDDVTSTATTPPSTVTDTMTCTGSECQKTTSSSCDGYSCKVSETYKSSATISACSGEGCQASATSELNSQYVTMTSVITPSAITTTSVEVHSTESTISITTVKPVTYTSSDTNGELITITSSSQTVIPSVTTIITRTKVAITSAPKPTTTTYVEQRLSSSGIATSFVAAASSTWITTPIVSTYAGSASKFLCSKFFMIMVMVINFI